MVFSERLKSIGWVLAGIAFFVAISFLGILQLMGAVWLSNAAFPWLVWIFWITFGVAAVILAPLAAFSRTRLFAANGLVLCSYVFGITLWVFSLLITWSIWGWIGVIFGLVIAGVGIVPVAFLAAIFKGEWQALGILFMLVVSTFGVRFFAINLADKANRLVTIEN